MERDDLINFNIKMHNETAGLYDEKHVEIYNSIEQERIKEELSSAIFSIETDSIVKNVLDYGSGTGNITKHLIEMGMNVVAGDVSASSLELLKSKLHNDKKLKIAIINGYNLSIFDDDTFDMITVYSVLHHVPDYIAILKEFKRIIKPGGIIYIDHEVSSSYWETEKKYLEYLIEMGLNYYHAYLYELGIKIKSTKSIIQKIFSVKNWKNFIKKMIYKKRITAGGDIHVFKEDHIEWCDIKELFAEFEIIKEKEYLVCRQRDDSGIWVKYKDICSDMNMLIVRKPISRFIP